MSDITLDEMRNNRDPGDDGIVLEAIKLGTVTANKSVVQQHV